MIAMVFDTCYTNTFTQTDQLYRNPQLNNRSLRPRRNSFFAVFNTKGSSQSQKVVKSASRRSPSFSAHLDHQNMLLSAFILYSFPQILLSQPNSTAKSSANSAEITLQLLQQAAIENDLQSDQHWSQFSQFAKQHSKIYETKDEVHKRFLTYKHNLEVVANQCVENEQGTAQYGETIFSDWTEDEFFSKWALGKGERCED
uniref:Cathepsin propeptide inhibitor domain-containing protein n=1 Tax=Ditylenchus dipsaci TaxID=166011 RepID=A0A915DZ57_9BILA